MEFIGTFSKAYLEGNSKFDLLTSGNIFSKHYYLNNQKVEVLIDGYVSNLDDFSYLWKKKLIDDEEKITYIYLNKSELEKFLLGSFTIVLFHHNKADLKIIRDKWGGRCVYFSNDGDEFIFSSSLKLICQKLEYLSLNESRLVEFLNWDYKNNETTFFNEIKRLCPSHLIHGQKNNIKIKKFLTSNLKRSNEISKNEKFEYLLNKSIGSGLNRDSRAGLMMSGGLDSSAIAISLHQASYKNIRTYSANFNSSELINNHDETKYQDNLMKTTGYIHKRHNMGSKSPLESIINNFNIFSEPTFFPNLYIFDEIKNSLMKDEIDIILDGSDGDSTISHGYYSIYSYLLNLRFLKAFYEINKFAKVTKIKKIRAFRIFASALIKKILNLKPKNKSKILKKEYIIPKNFKFNDLYISHSDIMSNNLLILANEQRNTFFRAHNIFNFSPFFDENLINFCLKLPDYLKFRDGYTRWILRDYLRKYLPKSHAFRSDKANLAKGLIQNFSIKDVEIVEKELKDFNGSLKKFLLREEIESILNIYRKTNFIRESDIIDLVIFINANIFMNKNNF